MLRLYWARNDGMTGHVFLGPRELAELTHEMEAQGMTGWLGPERLCAGERIPPGAIDLALARATETPQTAGDEGLWTDWLRFLRGAVENGGLVVR